MAAPSYGTDLATIDLCEATTNANAYGGGASGLSASPDLALEGTNCVDKQVSNADKGILMGPISVTLGANDHVFIWIFCGTPGLVDTKANHGIAACIGDDTSNFAKFHLTGSNVFDNTEIGKCWPIRFVNTSSTGVRTLVGVVSGTPDHFGAGLNTTATVKGANLGVDGIRKGTGFYITGGDVTPNGPGDFAGCAAVDATSSLGIFQDLAGAYQLQGRFVIGQTTSGTPTAARFEDSNVTIFLTDTEHSLTDFTQIIVDHASTVFNLTSVVIKALGTNNPGRLVFNNASTVSALDTCSFIDLGISTLRAGVTASDCTWQGCGKITANGASMLRSVISGYEGTAGTAALDWNTAEDPDGELDGSSFKKGTAATHAIEFGATVPTEITLRNIDFSGYSGTGSSAALSFLRTTGTTTVNLVGCTGTITAKVTGSHTVDFVVNPVTTSITVKDSSTKAAVSGAWVFLQAADGTGPLPFVDSSTWTRATTTATVVTPTAHNLLTGQKVLIEPDTGTADNSAYGVKTVTVTNSTTFTYTVTNAGATSGVNVNVTGVVISEVTTAGGLADDNRSFSGNQPVSGWARKHTASPYYMQADISGTVSSTAGLTQDVLVILDE